MELFMIKSRYEHFGLPINISMLMTTTATTTTQKTTTNTQQHQYTSENSNLPATEHHTQHLKQEIPVINTVTPRPLLYDNDSFITFVANASNNYFNNTLLLWNSTNDLYNNGTNVTFDYNEYGGSNVTLYSSPSETDSWSFCLDWVAAQHNLFQAANLFFTAAFLVPLSFKQSILLIRALLTIGFLFCTFWGGIEICAPDILLWNLLLALLNVLHTVILTWRFLPPALTIELTELYLKVFKPLRVSKKHFKELTKEAKVLRLEEGDIYAVEDVSAADEKLSILLRGKLRVTCDDTHLHFIHSHQFIDSPEWESNHEQSDDVFQVTITAEEDSIFLCWPRMRLERVLRHRPMLKIVLDSIIGKDITQKLYSVNEHLVNTSAESERLRREANHWPNNLMSRSLSVDAVHTGTRGHVRSLVWRTQHPRRLSITCSDHSSPSRHQVQCWVPLVANHFPATSPFTNIRRSPPTQSTTPLLPATTSTTSTEFRFPSTEGLLSVPQSTPPVDRKRSIRNSFRRPKDSRTQVKFQKQVKEVSYDSLSQRVN